MLAGGESVIRSVANSSLDPLNPNVSTMTLTPSLGYSSQSLVLDPTAPGHIHLRAPGANIDEPLANIFLGGEDSSFEVGYYTGSAPNVFIHSGGNTWTFDNTGNLTAPGSIITSGVAGNITGANVITANTFVGALGNNTGRFTLLSDNTLLSGTVASPQNFKVNDAYTPDIDIRNASGTGMFTQGANLTIRTAGTYNWNFDNTGKLTTPGQVITTPVPYANLTAIAGSRAFINNANLVAAGNFGAQVIGGGSNTVPAWSDGTNWYIG
jgi:hypothetical protein